MKLPRFGIGAPTTGRVYRDRVDAGSRLGDRLTAWRGRHALVLGIPRGGLPVAWEVAKTLDADLDVVVAHKLGAPGSPELAVGAVTADGGRFLNVGMIRELGVSDDYLADETRAQMEEALRREQRLRGGEAPIDVVGRIVVIVDDGLATGATMVAAARSVRARHPARLIVAVPVGSADACHLLRAEADEVVCLITPDPFWAVGLHYADFGQTGDDEVERIVREARTAHPPSPHPAANG